MDISREFWRELDEIAARTWPAERTNVIDRWLLRASGGVTKRANSVFAVGDYPRDPDWLQKIEQYYKAEQLQPAFHIGGAAPEGLDELLAANGYAMDTPCQIMVADSQEVLNRATTALHGKPKQDIEVIWTSSADTDWVDHFLQLEQYPLARKAFYTGLLERMPEPKGMILLQKNGLPIAAATVIVEHDWAGFVNVIVEASCRGQGLGYVLMQEMTDWSMQHGATRQYLQVIIDNIPAITLYEKLGYKPLFSYHYRIKV
ncbi:GNAT family N-acetyltransferase [Paenibacillus aestuarii]|uniref:GNAT family N-acetyltransferase n=1 Tax=Paenibacillus aestuarii TaxID=516965 RepID=A0ABW0K4P6_9BACL|nr:GNAT family N-acetyltransferase [Paenibacillus aestuarii]